MLKRKGCQSKKGHHCCNYDVELKLELLLIEKWEQHAIALCPGGLRSNAATIFYGDSLVSMFAHEIGHLVGNPDEYVGGAVDTTVNGDGAVNGIDANSIMGSNLSGVKSRHYAQFMVTAKAIAKNQYDRNCDYEAVTI